MPQELRVVKCFKCVTYQVDIVKKAKNWSCKMCGEQQTLKQEFGRGSGTECRKLVQGLNMKKHEFSQMAHEVAQKILNDEIEVPEFLYEQTRPEDGLPLRDETSNQPVSSKWETFIEASEEESNSEDLFKPKLVNKRKSYGPPETDEPQEISPDQPTSRTTSSFFNFNKKSKYKFDTSQVQESTEKCESTPTIQPVKPKVPNTNSKWGNYLNNSDEEE